MMGTKPLLVKIKAKLTTRTLYLIGYEGLELIIAFKV